VRLAIGIEHAGLRVCSHAASAVLVTYTFNGDTLFEIRMQWNGSVDMTSPLESIDPPVFQTNKALDIIGRVGQLDTIGSMVGDELGLVGGSGIARGMRTGADNDCVVPCRHARRMQLSQARKQQLCPIAVKMRTWHKLEHLDQAIGVYAWCL